MNELIKIENEEKFLDNDFILHNQNQRNMHRIGLISSNNN
jgi:hypothetical protein